MSLLPVTRSSNPLRQLESAGQSPWLDDLHRSLIRHGELSRLIEEDGLKGMTSNPSIFERAIAETDEYEAKLKDLVGKRNLDDVSIYESLAVEDVRGAADLFRPVYEISGKRDGYVSLEVSPHLANDTERTTKEADRLWRLVERENLMVKIPGTKAGNVAVRQTIGSGINVNVTLLFSIEEYEAVVDAYLSGLEDLVAKGGDPSKVSSVASFFLSRIDLAVDKTLGGKVGTAAATGMVVDKVAIASAKLAYARYGALFSTPRWHALAKKGARAQRLLWASTSTKKESLPDTYYVDALVGPDTVNTMPPKTMNAFREHGKVDPYALGSEIMEAKQTLDALESLGISLSAITGNLLDDGVKKFSEAFDKLLGRIAEQRKHLASAQR
jgi:transaldolase